MKTITPGYDCKLQKLFDVIKNKIENPINGENKKIIIFTAFADTANYLYEHVSEFVKREFHLNTAMITGSVDGKSTVPKLRCDLNTVLTRFLQFLRIKNFCCRTTKMRLTF